METVRCVGATELVETGSEFGARVPVRGRWCAPPATLLLTCNLTPVLLRILPGDGIACIQIHIQNFIDFTKID